jgi:hypothetical protein
MGFHWCGMSRRGKSMEIENKLKVSRMERGRENMELLPVGFF